MYTDTGANIKSLKKIYSYCQFFTFPYDSEHRRKKHPRPTLSKPSAAQWNDCHILLEEAEFPLCEFEGSEIFLSQERLLGKSNRRDILHLDSAYKEKVDLFLTSDKDDIWSHRTEIEKITPYKIFHPDSEEESMIKYINQALKFSS